MGPPVRISSLYSNLSFEFPLGYQPSPALVAVIQRHEGHNQSMQGKSVYTHNRVMTKSCHAVKSEAESASNYKPSPALRGEIQRYEAGRIVESAPAERPLSHPVKTESGSVLNYEPTPTLENEIKRYEAGRSMSTVSWYSKIK
jgi:hypothetical protein